MAESYDVTGTSGARVPRLVVGMLIGAGAAFMLDPHAGARRRALLRDKSGRYARVLRRILRGQARAAAGPLRGVAHEMAKHAPWHETEAPPDQSQYIKQRVESELGRDPALPLSALNFDAADAVVRIRGTVSDEQTARQVVERAAAVDGVRAVISLMRLPDGTAAGGVAGDPDVLDAAPRAAIHAAAVLERLGQRWPAVTDADVLKSDGHISRLVAVICERTGEAESAVRAEVDRILLQAV
jgi:hypothetical protein